MGYQRRPEASTSRGFGRPKRVRSKTKSKKQRLIETSSEGQTEPSPEELVSKTLNNLRNLGYQMFSLAPFYEYFEHWLMNLKTVLADFESSQAITMDDQFREVCSQVMSKVELALIDTRLKEASLTEAMRSLLSSKDMLSQTEKEHIAQIKEITARKEYRTKPLVDKVEMLQEELDTIDQMRTGFLKGISAKTKAQKEEEATLRLTSAKEDLGEAVRSFATEESTLREGYEQRKLRILEEIANDQREIERLESASQIDDSAEVRRTACENLADAVNALLKRTEPVSDRTESSS